MASTAYEVMIFLQANSVGTFKGTTSWALALNREPTAPIDVIVLTDTQGQGPDTDELDLLRPTFQVRSRSRDFLEGFSKHEQIRDLLILPKTPTVAPGYISVEMVSDIGSIGLDEEGRQLIVSNYRVIKERT